MENLMKVDNELGLVFGYAIVCKEKGEDYFDLHGDHIPEASMLEAATDFMLKSRMSVDLHARDANREPVADGQVVFCWPMTTEVAKSLGIQVDQTGLLIAMKPSEEVLGKFKSGEYRGFSIGGKYVRTVEVEA